MSQVIDIELDEEGILVIKNPAVSRPFDLKARILWEARWTPDMTIEEMIAIRKNNLGW